MDTQRAEEAVEDPPQDEVKHSDATVTIQSLYRGRKDRMRVKEARKWTEQFDPTTGHKYFYNSETGESQWEKPVDFFTGLKDERSARAVKIQSVFRAKKDRDRVKQLADEEEEEEQLEQQLREEREAVAAAEEKLAALAAESSSRAQWCEYFDPRSGRYYYRHSVSNTITWEKPEEYVSSWVEGSKRDLAALSIQCAARKRIAANEVAAKRNKLRALTDPGTMQLKLGELKQVSVEIQAEIEARALVSREEEQQFPHLSSLITDWKESFESIKSHVVSLENRAEDILLAECLAARIVHAERFHKALSEMRSECLALLRSILLMNSYFVDLDVARINAAFRAFTNWKSHEVCALKDSRLLEFVQGTDVCELLEHVDALLHRAMGPTDFTNGATSAAGKRYEDWHPLVAAALAGVREMEESLVQKIQMLRGYRAAEVRKREISHMAEEDLLASRLVHIQRRHKNEGKDHAAMLIKCQECWKKGLNQRDEDLQTTGVENINKMRRRNEPGTLHIAPTSDSDPDNNSKLSIWEATKEGLSVEVVSVLLSEEREKARRLGYNFVVKTTRSDHGETLIQIACWWGHELDEVIRISAGAVKESCTYCHKAIMLSISPPERVEQLISVFSQRLQPLALQRLSVAEILQDASALAVMQEEIPTMANFYVMKQQQPCFGRMLKFLHVHEPTGYERDEEHKRSAVRYLALRTMLQQCSDIKVSTIQEACISKMLHWFEETEVSATASTPILPPRMSPKKPCFPPPTALDKCPSESSFLPGRTTISNTPVAAKLEKYRMPDLRASHIRRIAELRSRGADMSDKNLPAEEDNNRAHRRRRGFDEMHKKEDEKRMVEATFKMYHPETDAEREMNLLWIRRRQEDDMKRKKDEEVQQAVQKWAMDRSRDESENLRKRESTKLAAGLGHILQEGVDQEKPFARQSSSYHLHVDLAGKAALANQSTAVSSTRFATKNAKDSTPQDAFSTHKQDQTRKKQPAQIVIKGKKTSTSSGGGMHFRNQLPPNYVPPGLLAASSVPKSKQEISANNVNTRPSSSKECSRALSRLERRASALSDDSSSSSEEDEEEEPATDERAKRKRTSEDGRHQMKLQSYHVPYYYDTSSDHSTTAINSGLQQIMNAEREVSSSRKPNKPRGDLKSAKGKRTPNSSRNGVILPRTAPSCTSLEAHFTASTSDLRNTQMEELEKIRRLFEENNLTFSSEALERGLLVPEDRPLRESLNNLPFPGSRLLDNPLNRSKAAKPKKKPAGSKKKKKKTKKGKKSSKAPKSSRRTAK
ncbi:hypothetical protein PInf_006932 [Phytophthora infestans]|nr:hypothetical protein PInf_006932 [Phytophthora infestans]